MQCSSGKATYPSRAIAKVVSKRIKRTGHAHLPLLRPYQCSLCGDWHLTSHVNYPSIPHHHRRPEKVASE